MKKLKFLFFPTILALAFGLMLSCAKSSSDDSSSSADTSSSEETNTSSAITVSGKVQKGPYIQGTEITVRELDSSMIPTGYTFTGTIDDNTGNFRVKGTLTYKIVELSADGYYFNEVSGSLSTAKLTLSALSDLTDSSSVNVNLMTHLEKKRVEYLMDSSNMAFAAAKTQAQTEILKIFNIENVTLGNSETLDISKSGDGNAALLAISAILQSDKTEAELTELLSAINTDIRYDGTVDVSATKQKLLDGVDYIKPRIATIRSNIETRYSNVGMVASIPAFESYVLKLDITAPTVASTSHADNTTKIAVNLPITATFSDYLDNSTVTSTNFFLNDNSSNLITSTITYSDKTATLTPSSNLSENGTHIATIKTGITDLAGHALESDYSWSFKTGDFTAPFLAEVTAVTTPKNDNTPSYTFSSTEAGIITYGGSCSSSTTAASTGNNTIDFNSLSEGTYSNNCTLKVTDSSGNAGNTITLTSFTIDTTAPTVSSTSPADNNTSASFFTSSITVTFSEIMDNTSVTTNTSNTTCSGSVQLSSNTFSSCVQMSSSPSSSNSDKTFTVDPSDNLSYSTTYKIRVTTGVKDSAGNTLGSQYETSTGFTIPWTKQLGTSNEDQAYGVATDSSGNVYVAGYTYGGMDGTNAGDSDLFVVKYNSSGTKQWTKQLGTSSHDEAYGVATDSSGNVYVAGRTEGGLDNNTSAGGWDLFVVKYNSSGTKQWTKQLGTSSRDQAYGVATDSSGNVYVTESTLGGLDNNTSAGSYDLIVVKYNSSGTKQWTKQLGTPDRDRAYGVATDSSGNVYVTGRTDGGLDGNTSAGSSDLFVVKYNSSGTKQWTKQLGTSSFDQAYGVATDSSGNVYVAGRTYGGMDGTNAGNDDLFVVKYNSSGTKQWTKQLGTSGVDVAQGVATDSSGNVYVAGYTYGGLDGNTSAGSTDLFVVKYNSSGTKQWTKQLGTSSNDNARGVATDSSGNVYVTGRTDGGLDGNTSAGSSDLFVVKYNSDGVKQ